MVISIEQILLVIKTQIYVCDLEYFNEFRTYLYDLFDWYFNVALNFIIKFRLTFIFKFYFIKYL